VTVTSTQRRTTASAVRDHAKFMADLRQAAADGMSMAGASRHYGYPYQAIYVAAKRHSIPFRMLRSMGIRRSMKFAAATTDPEQRDLLPTDPDELRAHYTGIKRGLSRWG
jgi:hypothetical protein